MEGLHNSPNTLTSLTKSLLQLMRFFFGALCSFVWIHYNNQVDASILELFDKDFQSERHLMVLASKDPLPIRTRRMEYFV
jgi:hypothetical protein